MLWAPFKGALGCLPRAPPPPSECAPAGISPFLSATESQRLPFLPWFFSSGRWVLECDFYWLPTSYFQVPAHPRTQEMPVTSVRANVPGMGHFVTWLIIFLLFHFILLQTAIGLGLL